MNRSCRYIKIQGDPPVSRENDVKVFFELYSARKKQNMHEVRRSRAIFEREPGHVLSTADNARARGKQCRESEGKHASARKTATIITLVIDFARKASAEEWTMRFFAWWRMLYLVSQRFN